ncbi:MAG TPA: GlpM family protein [Acinetobacter parvus]|uniref:GlpM family protein n=1 Tax=Acinetobacter parvus TaxID=134533 RepID=UPI002B6BA755|nr:GlpM family protein [Acinetobacter parvus]HRM15506.1 GlpM family protein [Acinetobacter parvus]
MWGLLFKSLLGAGVVVLIALLSKSKLFYIAGLVPLFPTFALIAHVIVAHEQGAIALQKTALFGLWALIPYFIYLLLVYCLATKFSLAWVLGLATIAWIVAAAILIYAWQCYMQ